MLCPKGFTQYSYLSHVFASEEMVVAWLKQGFMLLGRCQITRWKDMPTNAYCPKSIAMEKDNLTQEMMNLVGNVQWFIQVIGFLT